METPDWLEEGLGVGYECKKIFFLNGRETGPVGLREHGGKADIELANTSSDLKDRGNMSR